jgi:DNA invertase Pin-like site-specific DNA recombinase
MSPESKTDPWKVAQEMANAGASISAIKRKLDALGFHISNGKISRTLQEMKNA